MPLPGGSADKIGNRYELWWTALCLIDLLDERSQSIVVEPPGDVGEGIEFMVERNDVREYHQVKRQITKALGWSITTLGNGKVLKHMSRKLTGNADEFHFVSTMAAPDLAELSNNARQTTDFEQFRAAFLATKERARNWADLISARSNTNEAESYNILRRIYINNIDEDLLRSQVLARVSALVDAPERQAANELVIFALDSVNVPITPDTAWSHLRSVSLSRRAWLNDPHSLKALNDNNLRFLTSRRREYFRATPFAQPLAEEITESLLGAECRHTLITGEAGGGKSCLLVQIAEELSKHDVPFLVMRLDRLDSALRTTAQIGKKLDLPCSPVPLLAGIAQGRRSVLILDQLDAISLISGKNPELFDPIWDLFQEVTAFPQMRIVATCRAFDLDNDHRLKRLASDGRFVRKVLSPLARPDVLQGVTEAGFQQADLSESQVTLLSNPLNLGMLAQLKPPSPQPLTVETSIDLFSAFWDRKRSEVEQVGVSAVQFHDAIDTLCMLLEERGSLFVPEPLFCHDAAARLTSAHVFSFGDREWSFFHESFYDFANARRLYHLRMSVTVYLKQRGQGIELRNQLRQSLAFRRAYDFRSYCEDIAGLLSDAGVRFHIKAAAVAFLRGLSQPSPQEWQLVETLAEKAPGSDLSRALFNLIALTPKWFGLAQGSGAASRWMKSPEAVLRNLMEIGRASCRERV